ncbi:SIS domain-containing protein [Paucibacter sp. APW11]|uniref:SIS domain-containing protein n=1 Tax=Roseateles aquae TaxID=3077235 RepID=A0ABU3P942_9BURK|nr:SIS domain-containing protein [Paucibacter sp. APW11]MDT8999079.1 SIS domain-containing protein [Paucibacter sp. APW11]
MSILLTRSSSDWQQAEGLATAEEVLSQPRVWRQLATELQQQQAAVSEFLQPWLSSPDALIILTGAGSSAYIGQVVADEINCQWPAEVRAIATTSLLTQPALYLRRERPTLLISFARSGNSPESLAAVELLRGQVGHSGFLNITCNAEGELYSGSQGRADSFNLLMPAGTCDRGFAMTSSFSSMLLAALTVLGREPWAPRLQRLTQLAEAGEQLLQQSAQPLAALAEQPFSRLVLLGDGPLEALAREGALKMLELTAGRVTAFADSFLGFRHGPKAVLNPHSVVLLFFGNDAHARRYQLDLLAELRRDQVAGRVLAISTQPLWTHDAPADADDLIFATGPCASFPEAWLAPLWLLLAQQVALQRSMALGCTPDNPFPSGTVNRVVQGVTIYPLAGG